MSVIMHASRTRPPGVNVDEDHRGRADRPATAQVDQSRADGTQDAFLVRIHTDEGIVGVGEADTAPLLARTIVEMPSSHSLARGLREVLVGEDPCRSTASGSGCSTRATTTAGVAPRST